MLERLHCGRSAVDSPLQARARPRRQSRERGRRGCLSPRLLVRCVHLLPHLRRPYTTRVEQASKVSKSGLGAHIVESLKRSPKPFTDCSLRSQQILVYQEQNCGNDTSQATWGAPRVAISLCPCPMHQASHPCASPKCCNATAGQHHFREAVGCHHSNNHGNRQARPRRCRSYHIAASPPRISACRVAFPSAWQ
jgi:hypothetical protein